nr:hypothetical protein [uncultured Gellertiella sp.]
MSITDPVIFEIADRVATPFYLYDAEILRQDFYSLKDRLPEGTDIFYSLKANPNQAIVSVLSKEGAGAEVCSLTEMKNALAAGVNPRRIIFVGPAKSPDDIRFAIITGIKAIIAESIDELHLINEIAAGMARMQPVGVRINPDFQSAKVRITMSGKASQFGIDECLLPQLVETLAKMPNIILVGLHVYLGSRIMDEEAIWQNSANIFDLARRVRSIIGRQLAFVDIGGGYGVAYFDNERDVDPARLAERLGTMIDDFRKEAPLTRVVIELGRFLVARAGQFVTRVRYVKQSKGETFAICDGGSNVHAAAAGYGSAFRKNFPIRKVGGGEGVTSVNLTGPLCTPSDNIGAQVKLPPLVAGDLICIDRSGAYGPSASPVNFLSFGHPAEVLKDGARLQLVRAADDPDRFLASQIRRDLPLSAETPTQYEAAE